jgi:hypothetical protein
MPTPGGEITTSEVWVPETEEKENDDVVQTANETTDDDSKKDS